MLKLFGRATFEYCGQNIADRRVPIGGRLYEVRHQCGAKFAEDKCHVWRVGQVSISAQELLEQSSAEVAVL